MKASTLIGRLQNLVERFGDLDIDVAMTKGKRLADMATECKSVSYTNNGSRISFVIHGGTWESARDRFATKYEGEEATGRRPVTEVTHK